MSRSDNGGGQPAPPPDETDVFALIEQDLLAQARRLLGSAADAEDVVQDVWLRWHRHRPDVTYARAWLHTVTRNVAMDRLRERGNRPVTDLDLAAVADPRNEVTIRAEAVQDIAPGIGLILLSFSQLERTVFTLHDGLAWTYTDIARLLGRTEQTVRQLRHRARVNLAQDRVRFDASPRAVVDVSRAYVEVCAGADISALLQVLAPDLPVVPAGRRLVGGRPRHDVAGIALTREDRLLLCHRRVELSWYPDV